MTFFVSRRARVVPFTAARWRRRRGIRRLTRLLSRGATWVTRMSTVVAALGPWGMGLVGFFMGLVVAALGQPPGHPITPPPFRR